MSNWRNLYSYADVHGALFSVVYGDTASYYYAVGDTANDSNFDANAVGRAVWRTSETLPVG